MPINLTKKVHQFGDRMGRAWRIRIDGEQARRVRAALGIDLPGLLADKLRPLSGLLQDPVTLLAVLHCLCSEQASGRQVDLAHFSDALQGRLTEASEAFVGALLEAF